jgi:hypothetical protein
MPLDTLAQLQSHGQHPQLQGQVLLRATPQASSTCAPASPQPLVCMLFLGGCAIQGFSKASTTCMQVDEQALFVLLLQVHGMYCLYVAACSQQYTMLRTKATLCNHKYSTPTSTAIIDQAQPLPAAHAPAFACGPGGATTPTSSTEASRGSVGGLGTRSSMGSGGTMLRFAVRFALSCARACRSEGSKLPGSASAVQDALTPRQRCARPNRGSARLLLCWESQTAPVKARKHPGPDMMSGCDSTAHRGSGQTQPDWRASRRSHLHDVKNPPVRRPPHSAQSSSPAALAGWSHCWLCCCCPCLCCTA